MDSEFLTAEEVAEYLRLPLSTVYKLVQDKRLPGFKLENIGGFDRKPLKEWIKNQRERLTRLY